MLRLDGGAPLNGGGGDAENNNAPAPLYAFAWMDGEGGVGLVYERTLRVVGRGQEDSVADFPLQKSHGHVTAACTLPRDSQGARAVLLLGTSRGHLLCVDPRAPGSLLLQQWLLGGKVLRIRALQSRQMGVHTTDVAVLYAGTGSDGSSTVMWLKGSTLLSSLSSSHSSPSSSGGGGELNLNLRKWRFPRQAQVLDIEACESIESEGLHTHHRELGISDIPSVITVGERPMMCYHAPFDIDKKAFSTLALASSVTKKLAHAAVSWTWNALVGNSGDSAADKKEEDTVVQVQAQNRNGARELEDPSRVLRTVLVSPHARRWAACTDGFGRVLLVDLAKGMTVVRVWKGYRDAQCLWVQEHLPEAEADPKAERAARRKEAAARRKNKNRLGAGSSKKKKKFAITVIDVADDEEDAKEDEVIGEPRSERQWQRQRVIAPLFLLIYAPRRGLLELWAAPFGQRVGALQIGTGCSLLQYNASRGGRGRSSAQYAHSYVLFPGHELRAVQLARAPLSAPEASSSSSSSTLSTFAAAAVTRAQQPEAKSAPVAAASQPVAGPDAAGRWLQGLVEFSIEHKVTCSRALDCSTTAAYQDNIMQELAAATGSAADGAAPFFRAVLGFLVECTTESGKSKAQQYTVLPANVTGSAAAVSAVTRSLCPALLLRVVKLVAASAREGDLKARAMAYESLIHAFRSAHASAGDAQTGILLQDFLRAFQVHVTAPLSPSPSDEGSPEKEERKEEEASSSTKQPVVSLPPAEPFDWEVGLCAEVGEGSIAQAASFTLGPGVGREDWVINATVNHLLKARLALDALLLLALRSGRLELGTVMQAAVDCGAEPGDLCTHAVELGMAEAVPPLQRECADGSDNACSTLLSALSALSEASKEDAEAMDGAVANVGALIHALTSLGLMQEPLARTASVQALAWHGVEPLVALAEVRGHSQQLAAEQESKNVDEDDDECFMDTRAAVSRRIICMLRKLRTSSSSAAAHQGEANAGEAESVDVDEKVVMERTFRVCTEAPRSKAAAWVVLARRLFLDVVGRTTSGTLDGEAEDEGKCPQLPEEQISIPYIYACCCVLFLQRCDPSLCASSADAAAPVPAEDWPQDVGAALHAVTAPLGDLGAALEYLLLLLQPEEKAPEYEEYEEDAGEEEEEPDQAVFPFTLAALVLRRVVIPWISQLLRVLCTAGGKNNTHRRDIQHALYSTHGMHEALVRVLSLVAEAVGWGGALYSAWLTRALTVLELVRHRVDLKRLRQSRAGVSLWAQLFQGQSQSGVDAKTGLAFALYTFRTHCLPGSSSPSSSASPASRPSAKLIMQYGAAMQVDMQDMYAFMCLSYCALGLGHEADELLSLIVDPRARVQVAIGMTSVANARLGAWMSEQKRAKPHEYAAFVARVPPQTWLDLAEASSQLTLSEFQREASKKVRATTLGSISHLVKLVDAIASETDDSADSRDELTACVRVCALLRHFLEEK